MEVTTIPPMKPVLVTKIVDNINVLQQGDVERQRTVLTARAVSDIFKCVPIVKSNPTDEGYFDGDVVDLDRIVEACSRSLLKDQYKNGPVININSIPNGGSEWAIQNVPDGTKVLPGMLYVFSILDDGQLTWKNYDGVTSMFDQTETDDAADEEYRKVDDRVKSKWVRQIFVPNEFNEYLKFDGTKDHGSEPPRTLRTRYDFGVPWTRVGKVTFSSTMDRSIVAGKVYYHEVNGEFYRVDITDKTIDPFVQNWYEFSGYEWEPWYMQSKVHNGPEYFTNILLKDALPSIQNPLTDSIYHVYNKIDEFVLPNPNLDGYKVGQKIIIEVHPPLDENVESVVTVLYQDTTSTGDTISTDEQMKLVITPKVRRNTKDVYGNVRDDVLVTSVACFEIVEHMENDIKFRTWELDAGVEETDFTSGFAQMLGEHTDQCTGDLVMYQRPSISGEKNLTITFPITQSGYVVARFLKRDDSRLLTDTNWKAVVQIINLESSAAFTKIDSRYEAPDTALIYFIKEANGDEGVVFKLAENNGHPTSFISSQEYYKIDSTHASSQENVIQIIKDGSATPQEYLKLDDLEWDEMRRFTKFAHRNSILLIEIKTNTAKEIAEFQNKVFPQVLFYPDPHNSYIQKAAINPKAFTFKQLHKLFLDGTIIDDISLAVGTEVLEGIMTSPVSSRALIDCYTYLASKLQMCGRLFGNREIVDARSDDIDHMVDPGFYYVKPEMPLVTGNSFPPGISEHGCNVVVLGNDMAPGTIVHEEDGGIIPATRVVQMAFVTSKIIDDSDPDPLKIETRLGVKQDDGTWKWYPWRDWIDWKDIRDKPLYYHARWDYFENPDGFINHIDEDTKSMSVVHNNTTNTCEITHTISSSEISALMTPSSDPEYDENVNYDVPQFFVGIRSLAKTKWNSQVRDGEKVSYVVKVQLPDATPSQLTASTKDRRRKIRFLFYGTPDLNGWDNILFRLSYASSVTGREAYTYERNWAGSSESALDLEFEQADLPNGDRAWCPITIG